MNRVVLLTLAIGFFTSVAGASEPRAARAVEVARPRLEAARVGQKLEAEWHGSWWAVEVVATKSGFSKIHYLGWGTEWDEWVELDRLRLSPEVVLAS